MSEEPSKGERTSTLSFRRFMVVFTGGCAAIGAVTVAGIMITLQSAKPSAASSSAPSAVAAPAAAPAAGPPEFHSLVERGNWMFHNKACSACHGPEGHGGVHDPNYALDTVPPLDKMAEYVMLSEPEDAQKAVDLIEKHTDFATLASAPPFPGFARFVSQFAAVDTIIQNGAHAAKKDPTGPEPPLQMPAWHGQLTEEDSHAIIAYLITKYDWGE